MDFPGRSEGKLQRSGGEIRIPRERAGATGYRAKEWSGALPGHRSRSGQVLVEAWSGEDESHGPSLIWESFCIWIELPFLIDRNDAVYEYGSKNIEIEADKLLGVERCILLCRLFYVDMLLYT